MKGDLPGWDASVEAAARDHLLAALGPDGLGDLSEAEELLERALAEIARLNDERRLLVGDQGEMIRQQAAEIERLRASCNAMTERLVTESMHHGGTSMQRWLLDVANALNDLARGEDGP